MYTLALDPRKSKLSDDDGRNSFVIPGFMYGESVLHFFCGGPSASQRGASSSSGVRLGWAGAGEGGFDDASLDVSEAICARADLKNSTIADWSFAPSDTEGIVREGLGLTRSRKGFESSLDPLDGFCAWPPTEWRGDMIAADGPAWMACIAEPSWMANIGGCVAASLGCESSELELDTSVSVAASVSGSGGAALLGFAPTHDAGGGGATENVPISSGATASPLRFLRWISTPLICCS